MEELDGRRPGWMEDHVLLLLDNCLSHKSDLVRLVFASLVVPVVFTAPVSFKAVPVELFFAAIKKQNFERTVKPALEVEPHLYPDEQAMPYVEG